MLSNNQFSAVGLVILLCSYYFSPPTFTARDKPKQGGMTANNEKLQSVSSALAPSMTHGVSHAAMPNISLHLQENATSELLQKRINCTTYIEMSNISRQRQTMNTSQLVHAGNPATVPAPKCNPEDTFMANFSVLDVAGDREDRENGKGKGKRKVQWDEAAETAAVAGILAYKMLHNQKCPDVWVGGGSKAFQGSPTYGIGCLHPSINCWCPSWYYEGCVENHFPIAKFGMCKIAWWAWVGGGFIILSCLGCCAFCFMRSKRSHAPPHGANGPPQGGAYPQDAQAYGPPQGGAYPQDAQGWGQQPQYGQQYPQQGW